MEHVSAVAGKVVGADDPVPASEEDVRSLPTFPLVSNYFLLSHAGMSKG